MRMVFVCPHMYWQSIVVIRSLPKFQDPFHLPIPRSINNASLGIRRDCQSCPHFPTSTNSEKTTWNLASQQSGNNQKLMHVRSEQLPATESLPGPNDLSPTFESLQINWDRNNNRPGILRRLKRPMQNYDISDISFFMNSNRNCI